jgi:plastocyanin
MIRRPIASLVALAALSAVLALPAVGSARKPAPTATVKVGDFFFHPAQLKVKRNTTVMWHWSGMAPHNVTVTSAPRGASKFHSRTQTSGTYTHLLTTKGTYHLECTIHHFTMTINVT